MREGRMAFTGYPVFLMIMMGFIFLSGAVFPSSAREMVQNSAVDSINGHEYGEDSQFVVYYFHGNKRCSTCKKLEKYSEEGVHSQQVMDRTGITLPLEIVNFDTPENNHFMDDFDLYTQSLVITEARNGQILRWENLDQIWMLVGDREEFIEYVQDEICSFVKGE